MITSTTRRRTVVYSAPHRAFVVLDRSRGTLCGEAGKPRTFPTLAAGRAWVAGECPPADTTAPALDREALRARARVFMVDAVPLNWEDIATDGRGVAV